MISLIISLNDVLNKKYSKLDIAIVIIGTVSVLWSETRGFLLALMASLIMLVLLDAKVVSDKYRGVSNKFKSLFQSKWFLKKAIILMIVVCALPFLYKSMTLERFQEDSEIIIDPEDDITVVEEEPQINDESVNARLEFMVASKDILLNNPLYLVFGTGYGMEIADRLDGIEMSFLDILVEQGLVGLAIWFFLFLLVFYNYYVGYKKTGNLYTLEISLMAAFIAVLLVTNINPFINNPIGISFFLVLLILSQNWKESSVKEG
jgi:O-antigen ligase